jgi:hypothetical protein
MAARRCIVGQAHSGDLGEAGFAPDPASGLRPSAIRYEQLKRLGSAVEQNFVERDRVITGVQQ